MLAAVGEQSDKPIVSTFLGSEGVPELLRVPDLEGAAGRGLGAVVPGSRGAVRALARVVDVRAVGRPAAGRGAGVRGLRQAAARQVVTKLLREMPEGCDLDDDRLARAARPLRHHGRAAVAGRRRWRRRSRPASGYGWNVVLKATADHLRQRPDLAHVWRNIDDAIDMNAAWENLNDLIDEPEQAPTSSCSRWPRRGSRSRSACFEDALFGPIVSFGMAGTPSELLGDVSYRIPPLTDSDAADLVRDVRAAPLFFGYRGSEAIDVPAVEELIQRLAQLKDGLPEVQALDLSLVLAGAEGAEGAPGLRPGLAGGGRSQRLVHPPADRSDQHRRHAHPGHPPPSAR